MIEHVTSAFMEELEERRYRAYLTDALMTLTENTATFPGSKCLTVRWVEKFMPKDTRTGEEIVSDVVQSAGLTIKGGE